MMSRKRVFGTLVGAGILVGAAVVGLAKPTDGSGTTVTIYKPDGPRPGGYDPNAAGFAVVTQKRTLTLKAGDNDVKFTDVPSAIDPTTVGFQDLTDPDAVILEQAYEYDLGSVDKLLAKYIGQPITLATDQGDKKGVLLSFDATQLVIETEDKAAPIQIVQRGKNLRDIRFGELAGGLVTKPTLRWKLHTKKAGEHQVVVTYHTYGLAWSADYTVVLSADQKKVDVSGWLTVANSSGASFADAKIKLIAGDVSRAVAASAQGQPQYDEYGNYIDPAAVQQAKPRYEYAVPTTATVGTQTSKQVELFTPTQAGGGRVLVLEYVPRYASYYAKQGYPQMDPNLDGYQQTAKPINEVADFIEVKNTDKNGMGLALPAGKVRIYKRSDDGTLALMSEDNLAHTPKDGEVRIRVGQTTDVTGERKQTDFQVDERAKEIREKFELKLKNKRKEAVEVVVMEMPFRWRNWRVDDESVAVVMTGDNRAQFRVKVPASGEATLTWTMVYHTW